ncbi:MAG: hypothetical protein SGI88_15350 [Candidatus Hydrogenedentes bacterium]|nr:hypothetical protein [Candidatus Hydrogenedentota bacterium]
MNPKNRNKFIILGVLGAAFVFVIGRALLGESDFDRQYRENMEKGAQPQADGTVAAAQVSEPAPGAAPPVPKSQFQKSAVDVGQLIQSIKEIDFSYDTDRMARNPMTPLVGATAPAAFATASEEGGTPGAITMVMPGGDAQSVLRSFRVTGILWDKRDPMAVVTYPVKGELTSEVITRGFTFPESGIVVSDIDQEHVVLDANGTLVSLQLEER